MKKYGTKFYLKMHIQDAHTDTSCECSVCGKILANAISLKQHMRIHAGDPISCSYCPWKGSTRRLFIRHIKNQHMEKWAKEHEHLKCKECGKLLVTECALANHVSRTHGKNKTSAI